MRRTRHQPYSTDPTVILFLLALLIPSAWATEKCNPQDKKVLLGIKKYYHNAYLFSSWKPSIDCCSGWYMVKCDPDTHRVTSLAVLPDDLPGSIAPSIADLPYLKSLEFHKLPNITGPIPNSLAKLSNLEFLRLDFNALTGPVPDFLHTLKKLYYINLSFNRLSGSIPPSLPLAPSLDYLRLDRNRLTGPIPDTFGSVKNGEIFSLYLSHNQLSGEIPPALGQINISNILDLSRNNLTGDASFLFGVSKTVGAVDLSRNQLAFDFSEIEVSSQIGSLMLEHNKIYGGFPPSLNASIFSSPNFNVSYNRLCGRIPAGFGDLDEYAFFHNKCLCGAPLDPCS